MPVDPRRRGIPDTQGISSTGPTRHLWMAAVEQGKKREDRKTKRQKNICAKNILRATTRDQVERRKSEDLLGSLLKVTTWGDEEVMGRRRKRGLTSF